MCLSHSPFSVLLGCVCVCGDYFWKTEFSGIQNKRLRHHLKATHHILQPGYEVDMERDSNQCLNAGQMVFQNNGSSSMVPDQQHQLHLGGRTLVRNTNFQTPPPNPLNQCQCRAEGKCNLCDSDALKYKNHYSPKRLSQGVLFFCLGYPIKGTRNTQLCQLLVSVESPYVLIVLEKINHRKMC